VTSAALDSGLRPLAGRHALVTGGARGIGAAITRALLHEGAEVTMLGRAQAAQPMDCLLAEARARVAYVRGDVADAGDVARATAEARARFGTITILVNNAGQAASAPFRRTDAAMWRRMMSVNLDGAFHCAQATLPGMLEAGWGRIVNIASTAGLVGYRYVSAYCAAKHGVIGLTRALAMEVAPHGVTVNAVCPGYTATGMFEDTIAAIVAKTGRTRDEAEAELLEHNPQRRLVLPEEVANAVTWLCLPGSDAVNGETISVAGGEAT